MDWQQFSRSVDMYYTRALYVGVSLWSQLEAERAACNVGCSKGSKRKKGSIILHLLYAVLHLL